MASYELTPDAEKDLRQVANYTLNQWGQKALASYVNGLKSTFENIGQGNVRERTFTERLPGLQVTKFRHHFIFYLPMENAKPVIIGIIHERRDILSRLAERLDIANEDEH